MYTAAELILALQRRLQLKSPHWRRPPGEFPPGWQAWFDAMSQRAGEVTGATAQAIVDIFLGRPLTARPQRTGELTRWQAFATLWRQEWQAPAPEDRRTHLLATAVTLLWHLFFAIFLLWLMYTRFVALEAEQRRGEDVVQIEIVGVGTPKDVGGGRIPEVREAPVPAQAQELAQEQAQQAEQAEAEPPAETAEAAPALPAAAVATPEVAERELAAPVAQVDARDIPEPVSPPAPVEQRLEVSAPAPESSDFVLQAPTPPMPARAVVARDVQAREATVEAAQVSGPVSATVRAVPQRETAVREVRARVPEVAQREVNAPIQGVRRVEIAAPSAPQPTIRAPEANVRVRDVPAPAAATPSSAPDSSAAPATTTTSRPGSSRTPSVTSPGATAPAASAPATTARPAGGPPAAAGQGPRPVSAPGAFPTRERADDWGASSRNVPGGQRGEPQGLYDATGGPRLGESPVNPGHPPGTLDDRIVDLDRSGTWLKRKPTGYEPTSLDKYWRPNETLLQEWVRLGVKKMAIPIPGTNKKIECVVSILQFGGGCGVSDPNLNDQPARARPPPDIPFKPELQEDNGSVKPPGG